MGVPSFDRMISMMSLLCAGTLIHCSYEKPNAAPQPRLEAVAERRLEGVGCRRWFGRVGTAALLRPWSYRLWFPSTSIPETDGTRQSAGRQVLCDLELCCHIERLGNTVPVTELPNGFGRSVLSSFR